MGRTLDELKEGIKELPSAKLQEILNELVDRVFDGPRPSKPKAFVEK